MKQLQLRYLFITLAFATVLTACHKDKEDPTPDTPDAERAGVFILNQGGIGNNNSTLSYYNYDDKKFTLDIFFDKNAQKLGDTGNDIEQYGSKLYIVVNASNTIEVLNAKTLKTIKQISLTDRGPRYIVFNGKKAFISSTDGTVAVLDTTSLTVDKFITVGRNPEQMAITNGKLYVANSGGYDFGNPDKTVSVIDIAQQKELTKIEVGLNPVYVAADAYGDIYVISNGDYDTILPKFTRISSADDKVKASVDISVAYGNIFAISGDVAYIVTGDKKVMTYNVKTETKIADNFITDNTAIGTPYSIAVDDISGEVFVTDALNFSLPGKLFAFNKSGKFEYMLATGVNPGKVLLINK